MPFLRALVVMLPFAVALAVSGNEVMAHLSLLTLCLFFVAERLQFGLVQITFHWLVSLAGFLLLFHLRDNALLFAGACGLLTAAALYPQRWGRELTLVGK